MTSELDVIDAPTIALRSLEVTTATTPRPSPGPRTQPTGDETHARRARSTSACPVQQLIETVVFAPIGFVVNFGEVVPALTAKGQQQVQLARMIGQLVVGELAKPEGRRLIMKMAAETLMQSLGRRP